MDEKEAVELLRKHIKDKDVFNKVHSHSQKVKEVALKLAEGIPEVDLDFLKTACLLHDIGRAEHPPRTENAIMHGVRGAEILRNEMIATGYKELEDHALATERHIGAGITVHDIIEQELPLPQKDYMPISKEEKILTLADSLVDDINGKPTKIPIEKAVERFSKEINERVGHRLKKLHDEVMAMKQKQ